nr:MAG TPA: hypothetical protein [Caudoviricetes sp.]
MVRPMARPLGRVHLTQTPYSTHFHLLILNY